MSGDSFKIKPFGCSTNKPITADDFLHFQLEVHDSAFEAEDFVDVPLTYNVFVHEDGDPDHGLIIQRYNNIPRPNTIDISSKCEISSVAISQKGSNAIVPFSQAIFGDSTSIIGMRAGDFNKDGLIDVVYDTKDEDQNQKSFVFYQKSLTTGMTDEQKKICLDNGIPQILARYLERYKALPHSILDRFRRLVILMANFKNRHFALNITEELMFLMYRSLEDSYIELDRYLALLEAHSDNKDFLKVLGYKEFVNPGARIALSPLEYYEGIARISKAVNSAEKLGPLTDLFNTFCRESGNKISKENLINITTSIGRRLLPQEISSISGEISSFSQRTMDFYLKHQNNIDFLIRLPFHQTISWRINESAYYKAVEKFVEKVKSPEKLGPLIGLFQTLYLRGKKGEKISDEALINLAVTIGKRLSREEIIALLYAARNTYDPLDDTWNKFPGYEGPWYEKPDKFAASLTQIEKEYDSTAMLDKLYTLFKGPSTITPQKLAKYAPLLNYHIDPTLIPRLEDLIAAEKSIGSSGALLLWKKFGILRFNRYHSSILKHLVKMASDVNHDRHKPLIIAPVANYDESNVFDWGKQFKYDPRIRLVVLETSSREEFRDNTWRIRNTYGIPDVLFITAHGAKDYTTILGKSPLAKLTNGDIAKDFKGFFGDKKGQVVMNVCYAGAPPPKGKKNSAQTTANGFNAETVAARAVEGLLDLRVKITDEGQARLIPTYFEVGSDFFGFNDGGMTFYPNKDPVYERIADVNNSWQPSVAVSLADDKWHLGGGIGFSHQLFNRLRFRYDLLTDVDMNKFGSARILFNPEIAAGLTNHLMFASGIMGGIEFDWYENTQLILHPVIQQYSAFKLVIPSVNTEIDIGTANTVDFDNGVRPSLFFRTLGRIDILE